MALDLRLTGRGLKSQPVWPCISPGLQTQIPALAGVKGGIHTSAGWQVTLCDPTGHVSFP